MPLLTCEDLEGPELLLERDPAILTLGEVLYCPQGLPGLPWGVFDHGGRLVPPCGYFRGPHSGALDQSLLAPIRYQDVVACAPENIYVYGGTFFGHYGHFLLSTLCRYWAFDAPVLRGLKIVYHGTEDIAALFKRPFVADLFGAMGLAPADFVRFDRPTRIRNLVVPCPSFEETGFAHYAFSRLGHRLGDRLTRDLPPARSDVPAYLSKARLPSGVGHLVNEAEFSDVLARHGVDVIYPEQLSLAGQVALFRDRTLVAALTGSALHTSLFARARTIVGMSYGNVLYSSYTMIDRMNGAQSHYVFPSGDIELLPRSATFHLDYRLTDVSKTAAQFLRLLDSAVSSPRGASGAGNIALGMPTRQSSFGPREALCTPAGYRSTATSGVLTGRYQFHTDYEARPWWEVDLGEARAFSRIVLHNRADNSQERAARFVIESSSDGEDWRTLHRQEEALPFGNGLEGCPFVWEAPAGAEARLIRITLLETDFFHLDQIEVFDAGGIKAAPQAGSSADPRHRQNTAPVHP